MMLDIVATTTGKDLLTLAAARLIMKTILDERPPIRRYGL
jgi:hypothetical protein